MRFPPSRSLFLLFFPPNPSKKWSRLALAAESRAAVGGVAGNTDDKTRKIAYLIMFTWDKFLSANLFISS